MDCFVCHKESSQLTTLPLGRNFNRSLKAHTILSTALKMVLIKQLGQGIVAEVSNVCRSLINDSSASLETDALRTYPGANELMEIGAVKRPGIRTEKVSLVYPVALVHYHNQYPALEHIRRTYLMLRIQYT